MGPTSARGWCGARRRAPTAGILGSAVLYGVLLARDRETEEIYRTPKQYLEQTEETYRIHDPYVQEMEETYRIPRQYL